MLLDQRADYRSNNVTCIIGNYAIMDLRLQYTSTIQTVLASYLSI